MNAIFWFSLGVIVSALLGMFSEWWFWCGGRFRKRLRAFLQAKR